MTHLLKTKLSLSSLQTVNQSPGGSKCHFGALVYISCYDVAPSSFVLGGERTMKKSPSVKRQDGFFSWSATFLWHNGTKNPSEN